MFEYIENEKDNLFYWLFKILLCRTIYSAISNKQK